MTIAVVVPVGGNPHAERSRQGKIAFALCDLEHTSFRLTAEAAQQYQQASALSNYPFAAAISLTFLATVILCVSAFNRLGRLSRGYATQ